ncbi:MAG: aspartate carbamoyltransferase [Peptostreptococcaceae bacterium]|nr:aspartate carbamoyltransferase [Peptostreptococcaceae bacterium]
MRHLTEISDFSVEEISSLISVAKDMMANRSKYADALKGRILATLFYEPSTRTRLSFEAAMLRLGGSVIGFSDEGNTSVSKGETVKDTARIVSGYSDIIAMRHYQVGAPMEAASVASVPLINAGDGGNQHPTQTLTDLLTISSELGRLDNLRIVMVGDLKYGRTVHSLTKAMKRYKNNHFVFVSPKELAMPDYIKEMLQNEGITFEETEHFEQAIGQADVLYMTRIQKERFDSEAEYLRLKDSFILDKAKLDLAKQDMIVMHPLPRVNEITEEVDADSRAKYFQQARYGMFIRMALILKLVQENEQVKG